MIFPAKFFDAVLGEETLFEKDKFIRFERLAELFTYIAVLAGVFLAFLPYQLPFDRGGLFVFDAIVLLFSIIWFRFLPKKYSGRHKNFIYYTLSVVLVGFVVYFTGGLQSPVIFLFYLTCLASAASMGKKDTIFFTLLSALAIILMLIIKPDNLPLSERIGLSALNIWALVSTVLFSWFIFREEKRARESQQQMRLNKLREVNQINDQFVFIISSKLVAPLNVLREFITISLSSKLWTLTKEQRDILVKTEDNSKRLELLVSDMLDFSKIESGVLRLNFEQVDLGNLVSSTFSDFAMKAADKRISLFYDKPKDKMFVWADESRLHEVVANLIDNAIKYLPTGSRVKIDFVKKDKFVQVDVEDNGKGISEQYQRTIFQKFNRGDNEKGKVKGSGLGLFICRQLIERMGGSIWLRSKIGTGSTFSFTLPLKNDDNG